MDMERGWEIARKEGFDYGMFSLAGNRRVHDIVTKTVAILSAPYNGKEDPEIYTAKRYVKALKYFMRRYRSCCKKHGETSDTAVREAIWSRLEEAPMGYRIVEQL